MRGISLDAKSSYILVLESSLDLMLEGTQYLSTPRRIARAAATPAQCSSQSAFTMRGVSHEEYQHSYSAPELSSVLMHKPTRTVAALARHTFP